MSSEERPIAQRATRPSMVAAVPRRDPTDPPADPIAAALARIEGHVNTLVYDQRQQNLRLKSVDDKVDGVIARVDHLEGRTIATDAATKEPSAHDLKAQAELAQERVAREALAAEVATMKADIAVVKVETRKQTETLDTIKSAVVGVVTNKKLITIGKALFVLASIYLAGHGLKVLP